MKCGSCEQDGVQRTVRSVHPERDRKWMVVGVITVLCNTCADRIEALFQAKVAELIDAGMRVVTPLGERVWDAEQVA